MVYTICRILLLLFVLLYLAALFLLLVGTFGWFGQEPTPLAGVFIAPLGMPWILMTSGLPERVLPWAGVLAPLINIAILAGICRFIGKVST